MSELEEVSFWPGSADGSYARVGNSTYKVVTCRRRTLLIVAAVLAVIFIIGVSIPSGMLQHYKNSNSVSSSKQSTVAPTTPPIKGPATEPAKGPATEPAKGPTDAPKDATTAASTTNAPTTVPTPKPDTPRWGKYRLPRNISVSEYSISISLDLLGTETSQNSSISYDGIVEMLVQVVTTTDLIVLHAAPMTISKVTVGTADPDEPYKDVSDYKRYDDPEQLEIKLSQTYSNGTALKLRIAFNTTLSDDLHGFYKSSYKLESSSFARRVIATTQFEPTYARMAFPCFDEPDFKAKFRLNITRPKAFHSLFNTQLENTEPVEGDNKTERDIYGFSPVMSSYLVAFIVSDLEGTDTLNINSTVDNHTIAITIYGRKDQKYQLEFARNKTAEIIAVYEDLFNISYPLPKIDIVAIPDYEAGAMENWGLITFRESALLYDPTSSSTSYQQWVTVVIAHELAHQWFGNYVTMKWWNEIWLNEGFATFVGQLIGTLAVSGQGWPVVESYRMDVATASSIDSLHSSHALSRTVESVASDSEISSMFDFISYEKGSAIIHMLDTFVTRDVTKAALQDYLKTHKYSNAEASDLWISFDKAYQKAHPKEDEKYISTMMNSWTHLSGQPVLIANISDDQVKVSQEPFFLCKKCNKTDEEKNRTWIVPIQYQFSNGSAVLEGSYVLPGKEGYFEASKVDWVKLNLGWNGFYLVHYPELNGINITLLSDVDLANLIENTRQLFRAGYVPPEDFVTLLRNVMQEPQVGYFTTKMVLKSWQFLLNLFDQRFKNYSDLSGRLYKWINVANLNVSYDALKDLNVKERELLNSKLAMALSIDHNKVVTDNPAFNNLTVAWKQNLQNSTIPVPDKFIHKDIARQVGKCAFLSDEFGTWENLWHKYKDSKIPSEQTDIEVILTSANDVILLLRMLDRSIDEDKINKDETVKIIQYVTMQRRGRLIGWDFIRSHWDILYERFQTSGVSRLITTATSTFSDEQRLAEMERFFDLKKNKLGAGKRAAEQAVEKVKTNIYLMKNNANNLLSAILRSSDADGET